MKKWVYFIATAVCFALLCAFVYPLSGQEPGSEKSALPPLFFKTQAPESSLKLNVYDTADKEIVEMNLEDYVAGVILSEVPSSFDSEALKAQAVAARTFAVFKSALYSGEGCVRHPGADVCTYSGCCQGFSDSSAFPDRDRAKEAVQAAQETDGVIAVFRGAPIRALYHSSAGGHTENAENVYSEALAYLRGVPSPGEEAYKQFSDSITMTFDEIQKALSVRSDILLSPSVPLSDLFEVLERSETKRVLTVRVGLTPLSGNDLRRLLSLKSANFEMEFQDDSITFHTRGYGHGVGMSQTGADAMAKDGKSYEEILKWYYTGIELISVSDYIIQTQNSTEN